MPADMLGFNSTTVLTDGRFLMFFRKRRITVPPVRSGSSATESRTEKQHLNARVVKLGTNYIVLDQNNTPLTKRYPEDTFSFVVASAKSTYEVFVRDGKKPSDAIIALANYLP